MDASAPMETDAAIDLGASKEKSAPSDTGASMTQVQLWTRVHLWTQGPHCPFFFFKQVCNLRPICEV